MFISLNNVYVLYSFLIFFSLKINHFALNLIFFSDFGFKEESDQCVRDNESEADPDAVPTTCTPGAYYNRTKG